MSKSHKNPTGLSNSASVARYAIIAHLARLRRFFHGSVVCNRIPITNFTVCKPKLIHYTLPIRILLLFVTVISFEFRSNIIITIFVAFVI